VKVKSPREPAGPDVVLMVSTSLAPPGVGIFVVVAKEADTSGGRPETDRVTAGIVPVESGTKVKVAVYVLLVPRSTV